MCSTKSFTWRSDRILWAICRLCAAALVEPSASWARWLQRQHLSPSTVRQQRRRIGPRMSRRAAENEDLQCGWYTGGTVKTSRGLPGDGRLAWRMWLFGNFRLLSELLGCFAFYSLQLPDHPLHSEIPRPVVWITAKPDHTNQKSWNLFVKFMRLLFFTVRQTTSNESTTGYNEIKPTNTIYWISW